MVTPNFGQIFTRADIIGAVDAVKAVSGASGVIPGGFGGLNDLERVIGFIERVVPLVEQFGNSMMAMRGYENNQNNFANPQPYLDIEQRPAPPNPNGPPVVISPKISPIKVYSAALGALADLEKLDPELTVSKALSMARDYKEMILPMIEEKIPSMLEDQDA